MTTRTHEKSHMEYEPNTNEKFKIVVNTYRVFGFLGNAQGNHSVPPQPETRR